MVAKLVTRGYGLEQQLITRGYGLSAKIIAVIQQGAQVARTIVKTTITIIRFDIIHYNNGFINFHIGKFILKPLELTLKVTHIPKKVFDIVVHRLNFKFASNLSRIITGSKDIRIKTDDKNIP